MMKLLKSKRAVNDVSMIWTIVTILFVLGLIVPIVDNYFTSSIGSIDTEGVTEDVGAGLPGSADEAGENIGLDIMFSVAGMFFWSFNVWWPINLLILEPMRIILYILIYRQIRSGGG